MKYSPEQQDVLTRIASNVGQITFLSKALHRPEADKGLLRSRRHFCARCLRELSFCRHNFVKLGQVTVHA